MKDWKKNKMEYSHRKEGDIVDVQIRDQTRRVLYRNKFNIKDKNAIISFLQVLEKYSNFSIIDLIQQKIKLGDWW